MTISADDLPPAVRKRLGLTAKNRTRPAPSRAGTGHSTPSPGHCGCGKPFTRYSDWERHSKTVGCRHWRLDMPIPAPAKETP